ncbi:MAG: hypothetical protein ACJA2J_001054 [Candidatus Azotimanducaceae bacterium]|jgi:hypothetical protein
MASGLVILFTCAIAFAMIAQRLSKTIPTKALIVDCYTVKALMGHSTARMAERILAIQSPA